MSKRQNNPKISYEIDPFNRLVINKSNRQSHVSRFRQVLDGKFKVNADNSLSYLVKSPMPKGREMPYQVKLDGKWSLDKEHNLCLTLNKTARETLGDKLVLQGEIIDVSKNSLAFSLTTYNTEEDMWSIYILQLKGAWQADKHNRFNFLLYRQKGSHDVLKFKGSWEIDKNHQIVYKYEKSLLIRKNKQINVLTFKGHWDIKDKGRLYYVLGHDPDFGFGFKTKGAIFKQDHIKYELGAGLSGKEKLLIISGKWKIKKDMGLVFEVEYADKELRAITFGAEAKLSAKDSISFELKSAQNKNISAQLQLSRKLLKGDGLSFLRLLKSKDQAVVTVGAGFGW